LNNPLFVGEQFPSCQQIEFHARQRVVWLLQFVLTFGTLQHLIDEYFMYLQNVVAKVSALCKRQT
jgi:hypothetical protein